MYSKYLYIILLRSITFEKIIISKLVIYNQFVSILMILSTKFAKRIFSKLTISSTKRIGITTVSKFYCLDYKIAKWVGFRN